MAPQAARHGCGSGGHDDCVVEWGWRQPSARQVNHPANDLRTICTSLHTLFDLREYCMAPALPASTRIEPHTDSLVAGPVAAAALTPRWVGPCRAGSGRHCPLRVPTADSCWVSVGRGAKGLFVIMWPCIPGVVPCVVDERDHASASDGGSATLRLRALTQPRAPCSSTLASSHSIARSTAMPTAPSFSLRRQHRLLLWLQLTVRGRRTLAAVAAGGRRRRWGRWARWAWWGRCSH